MALWVNIGLTQDLARSLDQGAEGAGLYRTEVPFMSSSDRFPTEDEQLRSIERPCRPLEPAP